MLLPKLAKSNDLHLWLSAKVGKNNALPKQLKTLKFFEQDLFNNLLGPLIAGSKRRAAFTSFEGLRAFLESELKEVNQINSPDIINELRALSPDLIISIRYGGILKDNAISVPPKGVINLHSGILPKYKGVMATFWAMYNKDTEIGTTLHTIEDASIDTGRIINVSKMATSATTSYLGHVLALYQQGCIDILAAVEVLNSGESLNSRPQESTESYFTFPTEIECSDFEKDGFKLVDEDDYLAFIHKHYV